MEFESVKDLIKQVELMWQNGEIEDSFNGNRLEMLAYAARKELQMNKVEAKMSACPNCNKLTYTDSGHCEHGQWYFSRNPLCLICGEPCELEAVSFGFGSEFDSGHVCPQCARKYIDPAVTAAQLSENIG